MTCNALLKCQKNQKRMTMQKVTTMKMAKTTESTQVHLTAAIKFYAISKSEVLFI